MRFGTRSEYTVPNLAKHEFYIDEKILMEPLKRKLPGTIFVGDMFDLFHEAVSDALIDSVVAVMSSGMQQHTFQLLTKRAERMRDYFMNISAERLRHVNVGLKPDGILHPWTIRNLWLGVSVENPDYKWRINRLLETPAAIRFLSIEPQLADMGTLDLRGINWVICGGESGPGARPFDLAWAESLLAQCRAAGVPFFMKQVGPQPICHEKYPGWQPLYSDPHGQHPTGEYGIWLSDRKGGDPAEWPESLRVREFPKTDGNLF